MNESPNRPWIAHLRGTWQCLFRYEGFPPAEPRSYEINIAVQDIHAATTEADAAKAAAMIHRPGLDLADAVVNAFERKIAQLRALPRLPRTFNPLPLIFAAYRLNWAKQQTPAVTAAANKPSAPKPAIGPGPGSQGCILYYFLSLSIWFSFPSSDISLSCCIECIWSWKRSTTILTLPLIQERQLSVVSCTGEWMGTKYWHTALACPGTMWLG